MRPESGSSPWDPIRFRPLLRRDLDAIPGLRDKPGERFAVEVVSQVLPFRVNRHVVERLIDWDRVPDDPIYRLTFPQRGMLSPADFDTIAGMLRSGASKDAIRAEARRVQRSMNPHPGGQLDLNVPREEDGPVAGLQHKYRETVLFFPSQGQSCHAYCTYCFRWPQFVGLDDLKFASTEADRLAAYVRARPEITDVLITGGDPMVMRTAKLAAYIEPLLDIEHLVHIRIGTKALAYWPYRFTLGEESETLLRLFERVRARGKQLAVMAHMSHVRELEPEVARHAIRRVRDAGCLVRSQAPLIRGVNDESGAWTALWSAQLRAGIVPYYMFVERDTGPRDYFEVPLARAARVYREAVMELGGLGRTVRGPSMSATPGKVCVDGVATVAGERVFVLRFLQARDPDWVHRPFFARYSEEAAWLTELEPALGANRFFYEEGLSALRRSPATPLWEREEVPG